MLTPNKNKTCFQFQINSFVSICQNKKQFVQSKNERKNKVTIYIALLPSYPKSFSRSFFECLSQHSSSVPQLSMNQLLFDMIAIEDCKTPQPDLRKQCKWQSCNYFPNMVLLSLSMCSLTQRPITKTTFALPVPNLKR